MTDRTSFFRRAFDAMKQVQMARAEAQVARHRYLFADRQGRPHIQDPGR